MGRVSGSAVQPMHALGDLAYGGAGSPTGYESRLLASLGASVTSGDYAGEGDMLLDGDPATPANPGAGARWGNPQLHDGTTPLVVDLGSAQRIGRFRYVNTDSGSVPIADFRLQSSPDNAVWTTRYTHAGAFVDTGNVDLAAPITARYWRLTDDGAPSGGGIYGCRYFELYAVTTVGAGNPTRLPPPAERRVFAFDPDSGVPEWQDPGDAIDDLAATVGVDVAAATGTQVATTAELDATNTALNSLLAELRAAGVLASA